LFILSQKITKNTNIVVDQRWKTAFTVGESSASISSLFWPDCAIEVVLQPAEVIEFLSGLANHRTSIAIRRYPERFVRALASDARERGHLLLLQHARKKARDNYYSEYASRLSRSSLSFHFSLLRAISRCLSMPFIYTPFSSTSALFIAVISHRVIISFVIILLVATHPVRIECEQALWKIQHEKNNRIL
jgi:hypothetical protein